ncbi:TIGR03086 family metal-binding protein [Actinomadura fibrosa]|uniref:TIGR03086 family metal-binding protein n=1 Tax=Actinomadura fibrosa TaxID=111802 RepID=A0ABW2XQ86_9ACTN
MNAVERATVPERGSDLLGRSMDFAVDVLGLVDAAALGRPTPCRGWNLGMLLRHAAESLAVLSEAIDTGSVGLLPGAEPVPVDDPAVALTAAFRAGAVRLHAAWTAAERAGATVGVGGAVLGAGLVAGTGAIELAVHGWDIAWSAGRPREIPAELAGRLLPLASVLVTGATRHGLFAPPVPVPADAGPSDLLLAHLGRDPRAVPPPGQARGA